MHSVKFIEIDNLKVAYRVGGFGSPVVLLHGWGAESGTFKSVFDHLSSSHQVYALDLPGFGLSEIPPEPWNATDYAKLLSSFLDKLNIGKASLIGHSYGGRISIVIAANEPEKIEKVILVNSAGLKPKRNLKYYCKYLLSRFGRVFRRLGSFGNSFADRIADIVGSRDYKEAGPMRGTMVKSVNQDLHPCLSKIRNQTLLIWGEHDKDTPLSSGRIMEKEIPNSKLVVLKDAGHFSYLDQTEQFVQMVSNFLD
ncbi:alpha/beta hydrolase [Candidatus Poribacteria bacterium]|nr:MAG: alpha/beta hydrolase [Candidatus Poribacteria bacterium]